MHADQRAAVERVREKAGRKGVDLGLSSLYCYNANDWQWDYGDCDAETAALLVTSALAKWLAGQGCSVYMSRNSEWFHDQSDGDLVHLPTATDHLSALIVAVLARLDELPDKEKA